MWHEAPTESLGHGFLAGGDEGNRTPDPRLAMVRGRRRWSGRRRSHRPKRCTGWPNRRRPTAVGCHTGCHPDHCGRWPTAQSEASRKSWADHVLPPYQILDLNADLDLALDAAAPIDLAVAANANVAAPIDAAVGANILSVRLRGPGAGRPGRDHRPGHHRRRRGDRGQDSTIDQGNDAVDADRTPTRLHRAAAAGRHADPAHGEPPATAGALPPTPRRRARRQPAQRERRPGRRRSTSPRPINGAVAANANVAAPIDAAVAANIGSIDSERHRRRPAGRDHQPGHRRRRRPRRPAVRHRSSRPERPLPATRPVATARRCHRRALRRHRRRRRAPSRRRRPALGEMPGSGYREPPSLVRRADGQIDPADPAAVPGPRRRRRARGRTTRSRPRSATASGQPVTRRQRRHAGRRAAAPARAARSRPTAPSRS